MRTSSLLPALMIAATACTGNVQMGPSVGDGGSGLLPGSTPWPPPESPYAQVVDDGAACVYSTDPVTPTPLIACDPTPGPACGAAQRDCLGGPCVDGECGPCVLAGPTTELTPIALDSTNAYSGSNGIQKVPRDGGPVIQLAAEDYYVLTVDSGFVYALQHDTNGVHGLWRVSVDGGGLSLVATLPERTYAWVLDGTTMYVEDQTNTPVVDEVWSVDIHTGSTKLLASGYYLLNFGILAAGSGGVWGWNGRMPGTAIEVIRTAGDAFAQFAAPIDGSLGGGQAFDQQLYFTMQSGYDPSPTSLEDPRHGGIWRIWPDGSHLVQIASCQPFAYFVVVDGAGMYWNTDKHVMKLLPGGQPVSVFDTNSWVGPLTMDDQAVYWAGSDGVIKLAR